MPLPRKDSPSSTRFQRRGREPCFPQTARGPGPLGTMLSAALAIANAVQFSVCSGVLRVLGLARAGPKRGIAVLGFFALGFLSGQKRLIRRSGRRPGLSELDGGRECGELACLGLLEALQPLSATSSYPKHSVFACQNAMLERQSRCEQGHVHCSSMFFSRRVI